MQQDVWDRESTDERRSVRILFHPKNESTGRIRMTDEDVAKHYDWFCLVAVFIAPGGLFGSEGKVADEN
jgi:hypothetical protein